jgi:threonylcarbamoyladenosine tRNA methylthiotransferase MtaB
MRVYLETLGCRLNFAEMASLGRQLAGAGHAVVSSANEADVCVLNSCAVTGEAARKSRQLVRQLARSNPAARLVVTGCYATLEGATVAALPNVTLVVGNERKDKLIGLLADQPDTSATRGTPPDSILASFVPAVGPAERGLTGQAPRTRAFVKVQDGCHNRCSFCIVTVARGEERSRTIAGIVTEIQGLQAVGYQEAILTGVHLGAYGRDFGSDVRRLIGALLADTMIPRLRLSSLEPFDLQPDFFDLWSEAGGRLMPHLHLPAQSGSDAVLRRMARRNRVADFEALVSAAREGIPGLTVTTDLIAGFPGETEEDFAATLAFARRAQFAHIHVFPYSARAGTAAARMSGQVPETVRHQRSRVLNELDAELGTAVRAGFVGTTRPVLWENMLSRPSPVPNTILWAGLTDNYLRVHAAAPAEYNLHNRITQTRLLEPVRGELWGELVELPVSYAL